MFLDRFLFVNWRLFCLGSGFSIGGLKVGVIGSDLLKKYDFGAGHPFRGDRFESFFSFFDRKLGSNDKFEIVLNNKLASDSDLELWHEREYIDAVKKLRV